MWTRDTRLEHDRDDLRYPSDLTDAEWAILEPLLPSPSKTGRKRGWPMREIINAIFFVLRGGCPWRMLPEHFPPHQTTYAWFAVSVWPATPCEPGPLYDLKAMLKVGVKVYARRDSRDHH
jgi:transposase